MNPHRDDNLTGDEVWVSTARAKFEFRDRGIHQSGCMWGGAPGLIQLVAREAYLLLGHHERVVDAIAFDARGLKLPAIALHLQRPGNPTISSTITH